MTLDLKADVVGVDNGKRLPAFGSDSFLLRLVLLGGLGALEISLLAFWFLAIHCALNRCHHS